MIIAWAGCNTWLACALVVRTPAPPPRGPVSCSSLLACILPCPHMPSHSLAHALPCTHVPVLPAPPSPPQVGDIGLMGSPAKKDGKATEGFKIMLGGKVGENPALATDFEKVGGAQRAGERAPQCVCVRVVAWCMSACVCVCVGVLQLHHPCCCPSGPGVLGATHAKLTRTCTTTPAPQGVPADDLEEKMRDILVEHFGAKLKVAA